ncbi:MAG: CpsD/CapB family tyrosine-protein kinase [Planctomycetota bacterium]|jgi:capsular exopolysaccharide synthesis family protein
MPPAGLQLPPKVVEDYLRLSENILALNIKKRIKTIAVSSTKQGEGSSTVVFNLALTLAKKGGSKILLIDGNLRRPSLHKFLKLEKERGLTEMILGQISLHEALKVTSIPNLLLVTSGNKHKDYNRIFTYRRFKEFVEGAGNHSDLVLFDSPPVNQYSDSAILTTLVDGMVLVIQAETVIYEVIRKAKEKIENSGGKIIGAVLNRRRYYIPNSIYKRL